MPAGEKETWKARVQTKTERKRERERQVNAEAAESLEAENQFDPYSRNVKYPLAWISRPSSGRLG